MKKKKEEKERKKNRKKNRKIDTERGSQYHTRVGEQSRGTKRARWCGASIHETHCRAPWWTLNAQEARTKLRGWSSLKWKPFWRTKRRTPLKRWEWRFGKRETERWNEKEERESWTTESTFISPTSWLLMGCSKTVRNNLKPPRPSRGEAR